MYVKNNTDIFMFLCTTILYEYMTSLRNDVCNLFPNMHVRIKTYHEFYHYIIHIANEGRHVRIKRNKSWKPECALSFNMSW